RLLELVGHGDGEGVELVGAIKGAHEDSVGDLVPQRLEGHVPNSTRFRSPRSRRDHPDVLLGPYATSYATVGLGRRRCPCRTPTSPPITAATRGVAARLPSGPARVDSTSNDGCSAAGAADRSACGVLGCGCSPPAIIDSSRRTKSSTSVLLTSAS